MGGSPTASRKYPLTISAGLRASNKGFWIPADLSLNLVLSLTKLCDIFLNRGKAGRWAHWVKDIVPAEAH